MLVVEVDATGRASGRFVQDNQRTTAQNGLRLVGVTAKVADHRVHLWRQMLDGVQTAATPVTIVVHHHVPSSERGQFHDA
ncbi:hypothetical protein D9M72_506870 [compost metagenome]